MDGEEHKQQDYYVTCAVDLIAIITARDVSHYDERGLWEEFRVSVSEQNAEP